MKELKDSTTAAYIISRTGLKEGEELDVLGNAVCLTAYYGDMLEIDQIAFFCGMTKRKFRKKLQNALDTIYFVTGALELSSDSYLWEIKPDVYEFVYSMAAGAISVGYYPETQVEPFNRRYVREWLNHFFLPGSIRSAATFRGYLAVLEYLTSYLRGTTELTPTTWLRCRYGTDRAQKDVKAFLSLSWEYRTALDGVSSLFEGELSGDCPKMGAMLKRMSRALTKDFEMTRRDGKAF